MLEILFFCITAAAIAGFLNHKVLKMPPAIGITIISSLFVLLIEATNGFQSTDTGSKILSFIKEINFYDFLLNGALGFLLFASAIKIDVQLLKNYWRQISSLATIGVLFTSFIIAGLLYWVSVALGIELPFVWCLLFGAFISPTDPIAALAILKSANAPKSLEMKLAGEAMFNDGMAIVIFMSVFGIAAKGVEFNVVHFGVDLVKEIFGAVAFGGALGALYCYIMKHIKDLTTTLIFTLSLCLGSYMGALLLHFSAPISVVVSGLVVGTTIKKIFSEQEREHVEMFWEFLDELLNISLFIIIGLEVVLITFTWDIVIFGVIAFAVVCLSRLLGIILTMIPLRKYLLRGTVPLLSWGGIRGGISLALALAVGNTTYGNTLLPITFIVVILSGIVQGLTLKTVINYYYPNEEEKHLVWYEKLGEVLRINLLVCQMTKLTDKFVNFVLRLKPVSQEPHAVLVDSQTVEELNDVSVTNEENNF
jgi:sodium/hydrogen exchanger